MSALPEQLFGTPPVAVNAPRFGGIFNSQALILTGNWRSDIHVIFTTHRFFFVGTTVFSVYKSGKNSFFFELSVMPNTAGKIPSSDPQVIAGR